MAKNNAQWLNAAAAEAFQLGTHVFIKTNLRPPKASVLPVPGHSMREWDPRGQLAKKTWNKIIQDALSKIEYQCFKNAVVLTVVRSPFPRFDPINMNPEFALEAMMNYELLADISPGRTLYTTIGHRDIQGGTDFYIGPPDFVPKMMQIIAKILGDSWTAEKMGMDYFLTAQPREIISPQRIPPREWPISRALAQVSGKFPEASFSIEKTHIVFKTNIHPPQVGILVPQGFLPFPLYVSWVKEARGIWIDLLEKHHKTIALQTIKKSVVLIVFRTQNFHFHPINYDIKAIMNALVDLRIIEDDASDTLAFFTAAQRCSMNGGIDIYVGTPEFLQEITKIMAPILRWNPYIFHQNQRA